MDQSSIMSRVALGNVASLGELYDGRTDRFCSISIFKKTIPETALTHYDNHFSDIQLVHSDTFKEKFAKLDVSAELKVSVLAGLFPLQGSGRYLKDQKNSSRSVKSSLIYNIRAKEDNVNIYSEELKDAFALEAIQSGVATHVVVGITWGANSVLSCEYLNTENRDVTEIEGHLSAQLNKLSLSISGKAGVDFKEGGNDNGINFSIRIYGDVLPRDQELPTTFEAALELMKNMPKLIDSCNNGRGMPLNYKLIPLTLLKDYLKFEMKVDLMVTSLQEYSLVRIAQLFEKLNQAQQKLNDFEKDATQNKFALGSSDITKVISLVGDFSVNEAKFRAELGKMLWSVRSGKAEGSELESLLSKFESSPCSSPTIESALNQMNYILGKIASAKTLVATGIKYIGHGTSLEDEIVKNFDTKTYILYFNEECKTSVDGHSLWQKNRQIFLQEANSKSKEFKFMAVDCNIHESLWPGKVTIQVLEKGEVITHDLIQEQDQSSTTPIAKCTLDMDKLVQKPSKRVKVVIPCGGKNCKPNVEHEWLCWHCNEVIEYGFDTFFYCGCGRGPISMYEFKCPDPKHGTGFERHPDKHLEQLLEKLNPFRELNILTLGEIGVGKSTWINGFGNFMAFDTLEEAESNDLCTPIPSEFTICDEDFNGIRISTGTDSNEIQNDGTSTTQECKVYPFTVGNCLIRLIDTPGIGDTCGMDRDKKNFQKIISTLSHLQELHGICILLKPNNTNLTVTFRYCIQELLTYLHRDACRNIMFCFTNSRGSFYGPGDTLPTLKNILNENEDVVIPISHHKIYFYDSEFYRFLAAVKNRNHPFKFSANERKHFAESWEKSISETKRMIKHISQLKPHPIQSTISLNHARELVLQLTKTLVEIMANIHTNKEAVLEFFAEMKKTFIDAESLRQMNREEEQRISEQKQELKQIELASIKFACFLKHRAIMPYNDAKLKYMDHLIEEEKRKTILGGREKTLEQLQLSRSSYERQIKILVKEMAKGDNTTNVLNPADVEKVVKELYKLPHNGITIKNFLDAVRIFQFREVDTTYKLPKNKNVIKGFEDWVDPII